MVNRGPEVSSVKAFLTAVSKWGLTHVSGETYHATDQEDKVFWLVSGNEDGTAIITCLAWEDAETPLAEFEIEKRKWDG